MIDQNEDDTNGEDMTKVNAAVHSAALRGVINDYTMNMEYYIEIERLRGMFLGSRLKALLDNGFSRAEAVEVICQRGLS